MFEEFWQNLTALALVNIALIVVVIPVVLIKKRHPVTAVAWCLVVLLMPMLGAALFWTFGYNYMERRVTRKTRQRRTLGAEHPPARREAQRGAGGPEPSQGEGPATPVLPLADIALAVNAFPVSQNNSIHVYRETNEAFEAMLEAIRGARHHIHLEFFIVRSDGTGRRLFDLLAEKARAGVQVRLLYDSAGSLWLSSRMLQPLIDAGGQVRDFMPINPLRSWLRLNLRNHRKITVVDGDVGFTGGMNIADEYLGKSRHFGYWRDTMLRLHGPAVAGLARVFMEDWHFAATELLKEEPYFPFAPGCGEDVVQVIDSGPEEETNSIREMYFAAILSARKRLWIASPYFVPDSGILDALRLARLRNVDVRFLGLLRPDHHIIYYAGRYYWSDLLRMGVRVYQYSKGMMHSKMMLVDDCWAMVGSANLDNRSLHLNCEAGCIVYSRRLIDELAADYLRDLEDSIPLDSETYAQRSLLAQLTENACRLFSPIL
jgi:cardiolipin synthase